MTWYPVDIDLGMADRLSWQLVDRKRALHRLAAASATLSAIPWTPETRDGLLDPADARRAEAADAAAGSADRATRCD
jgi:hypothetical protein